MDPARQPGIRFVDVELIGLRFAVKGEFRTPINTGLNFDIKRFVSEDKKALDVFLTVDLFRNLKMEERPPIDFAFTLAGHFVVGDNPNMSLDEFGKDHAPAHMFPFIRELISNITARSPLPTLNIGPINVAALVDSGQAEFEFSSPPKHSEQVE